MRVLVLGAGYAGLTLARRLEEKLPTAAELVVVSDSPDHLVLHEVHRVVRRPAVAEAITVPLRSVLDRAQVVETAVTGIDRDDRRVDLSDGSSLSYDVAAVCLGSATAFYGLEGVREHAAPLKSVADAEAIRTEFLDGPGQAGGTVVVGGAGLSGVQVAGELAAFARERDPEPAVDVLVLEQLSTVAPGFPESFQRAVREELQERGVTVRTDVTVEGATDSVVETDAGPVPYDQLVWTGGITGQPAMADDRPVVRGDLRLDDRTFALGDAARVVDADGEAVPASASAAIREARTAATNITRVVRHELDGHPDDVGPHLDQYRFSVPGWIVSVGDGAVAQVGPTVVRGAAAKAMKATVGAGHLGSVGAIRNAVDLAESEL
jgi:NADH dehydrogenase